MLEASTYIRSSSDQIAAIEEAFYNFDENNDGLITSTEFRKILDRLGEKGERQSILKKAPFPCLMLEQSLCVPSKSPFGSFSP